MQEFEKKKEKKKESRAGSLKIKKKKFCKMEETEKKTNIENWNYMRNTNLRIRTMFV